VILNPWLGIKVRGYFWKNHKRSINDNFSFARTRHILDSQKLTKKFCAKTLFASLPFLFASLCFRFASPYSILKIKFALFASPRFFVRFASLRFLGELKISLRFAFSILF